MYVHMLLHSCSGDEDVFEDASNSVPTHRTVTIKILLVNTALDQTGKGKSNLVLNF